MADWLRHARADEIANGYFHFINTNVRFGDDGISGLIHHVPIAQTEWLHDGTANHVKSDQFDAGSSRIMTRIAATANGVITSRMRKVLLLPRDYGRFQPFGFRMTVRCSSPPPTATTMTVKRNGTADSVVNDLSILPAAAATFEIKELTITSTTYLPGELILLEYKLTSGSNGEYCEVGDVAVNYVCAGGNI